MRNIQISLITLEGDLRAQQEVAHQVEKAQRANKEIAEQIPIRFETTGSSSSSLAIALEQIRDTDYANLVLSREFVAERGQVYGDDQLRSARDDMSFSLLDLSRVNQLQDHLSEKLRQSPGISQAFLIKSEIFVAVGSYIAEGDLRGVWIRSVKGLKKENLSEFLDEVRTRYFFVLLEAAADGFMPEPPASLDR